MKPSEEAKDCSISSAFFCGHCLRSFSRKEAWVNHFKNKQYRSEVGGYASNPCYNLPENFPRVFSDSVDRAQKEYQKLLKAQQTSNIFFKKWSNKRPSDSGDNEPGPSCSQAKVSKTDENIVPKTSDNENQNDNDKMDSSDIELEDDDDIIHSESTTEVCQKNLTCSEKSLESVFNLLSTLVKDQAYMKTELKAVTSNQCEMKESLSDIKTEVSKSTKSTLVQTKPTAKGAAPPPEKSSSDETFTTSMLKLKHASSMQDVLDNFLVKDSFKLIELKAETAEKLSEENSDLNLQEEGEDGVRNIDLAATDTNWLLYCVGCSDKSLRGVQGVKIRSSSFFIKDKEFNMKPSSDIVKGSEEFSKHTALKRWFINFKMALRRHCDHIVHHQLVASHNLLDTKRLQNVQCISRMRLNIMYYILRTNSSFTLYPVLLAVLSRCGFEIGNKNSSRSAMPRILKILGKYIDFCPICNFFEFLKQMIIDGKMNFLESKE